MKRSMSAGLVFLVSVLVGTTAAVYADTIFNNFNSGAVTQNGSRVLSPGFFVTKPVQITQIVTYHWNNGQGDNPGTIELACHTYAGGTSYFGPYQAHGVASGNVKNANFVVDVNIAVQSQYHLCQVFDSRQVTWSYNTGSGGSGFARVYGTYIKGAPPAALKPPPPKATGTPPALGPIQADFVQAQFSTNYTIDAEPMIVGNQLGKPVTYSWALKLECVDSPCNTAPPPNYRGAALDQACNNLGKVSSTNPLFTWHHGDARQQGGCNHNWQGKSGHEGIVTLVVQNESWSCTLEYRGSETGKGSAPVCTPR